MNEGPADTDPSPALAQDMSDGGAPAADDTTARRSSASVAASPFPTDRIHSFILRFINRLKISGKSPHTIAAYRNDLALFSRFIKDMGLDPTAPQGHQVALDDLWAAYLASHGRHSEASIRRARMSIRTFLRFLVETEVIQGSPLLCSRSPRQPQSSLFAVEPGHFRKICKHLDRAARLGDHKALRDLALVLVLGRAGLKASEAAALTWSDLNLDKGRGEGQGRALIVVRTGEHARLVPVSGPCRRALEQHRIHVAASEHGEVSTNKGDSSVFFGYQNMTRRPSPKGMQRHSVKFIIYELCRDVIGTAYNAESFRNHAILGWIAKGYSASRVAELAGYSSLQSLERFLTVPSTQDSFRRNLPEPGVATDERESSDQENWELRDP